MESKKILAEVELNINEKHICVDNCFFMNKTETESFSTGFKKIEACCSKYDHKLENYIAYDEETKSSNIIIAKCHSCIDKTLLIRK